MAEGDLEPIIEINLNMDLNLNDLLNDINPPNRTRLYDRATSITHPPSKDDEEEEERSPKREMVIKWVVYGAQVALSTAVFHPFSYARVLMEIGFEPFPPGPSRTILGKPCLILPNITSYVRFIKARDGRFGLWRGLSANFCTVLINNLSNDLTYHLIDEFVKRKIRASPRRAWNVFVLAHQENTEYSVKDFMEDLTKEVLSKSIGLSLSYPFQVVFLRIASQFVYQEKVYSGLFDSFLQIYRQEGFSGFYGGFLPYAMSEIGAVIAVWIGAYTFRAVITGDRLCLTIFRFATDYIVRTFLYPFKLVGRIMAISPAPLKIISPPILPKFKSWVDCYRHIKAQDDMMRGYNIFFRVVRNDQGAWNKLGYSADPKTGFPVKTGFHPSSTKRAIMPEIERYSTTTMSAIVGISPKQFGYGTFRTSF